MTEVDLQRIEEDLGVRLPDSYRAVAAHPPFSSAADDGIYWLFDDPESVIYESRFPLADGEYDLSNWIPTFFVIGRGASSDLYLLDAALSASPVYCLSHEDHEIVEEFPNLEAYIAYMQQDWQEAQRQTAESTAQRERTQWQAWAAFALCLISLVLTLIFLVVEWFRTR